MRFEPKVSTAGKVSMGGFALSKELVDQINAYEPIPVTNLEMEKLPPEFRTEVRLSGNG